MKQRLFSGTHLSGKCLEDYFGKSSQWRVYFRRSGMRGAYQSEQSGSINARVSRALASNVCNSRGMFARHRLQTLCVRVDAPEAFASVSSSISDSASFCDLRRQTVSSFCETRRLLDEFSRPQSAITDSPITDSTRGRILCVRSHRKFGPVHSLVCPSMGRKRGEAPS